MKRMARSKIIIFVCVILFVCTFLAIIYIFDRKISDNSVIGSVNDQPIYWGEFKVFAPEQKTKVINDFYKRYGMEYTNGFWFNKSQGASPLEQFETQTLDKCYELKIKEILAKEHSILDDISYAGIVKGFNEENANRKKTKEQGGIVYGSEQFQLENYFDYVVDSIDLKLQHEMDNKFYHVTDREIKEYYNKNKHKLFDKPGGSFKDVKDDIRLVLVEKAYNYYIQTEMGKAKHNLSLRVKDVLKYLTK